MQTPPTLKSGANFFGYVSEHFKTKKKKKKLAGFGEEGGELLSFFELL